MFQIKRSVLVIYGGIVLILVGLLLFWPGLPNHLFSTNDLTPFSTSIGQQPSLITLFASSNFLIGVSFLALAIMLVYVMYRTYKDIPFNWIYFAFASFLVASGIAYLLSVLTLWTPLYWLSGYVRLVTAVASVATALAFPMIIPRMVALSKVAKALEEHERQLELANAKLESLYSQQVEIDHIKSNFFAGISHELRTPLTLLLGPMRHLLTDPTLPVAHRSILTVAERNGQLLQHYINDLLDVSQLQTGQASLMFSAIDLAARIRISPVTSRSSRNNAKSTSP